MTSPETITVAIRKRTGEPIREVEGRIITPELAITPGPDENRYAITHIPSGLALMGSRCAEHVETAAQLMAATGINWARDTDALVADVAVRDAMQGVIDTVGFCYDVCDPRREGPSWSVRCNTCDWVWEDEYNEGPLDAKAAKRLAQDHECEPDVQLSPPGDGNKWFVEWLVSEDGTVKTASVA